MHLIYEIEVITKTVLTQTFSELLDHRFLQVQLCLNVLSLLKLDFSFVCILLQVITD